MITKEQAFTALENQTKLYYHDNRENKIGDMTPKIMGRFSDIYNEIRSMDDYRYNREPIINNNLAMCEHKCIRELDELYLNREDVAAIVIQKKKDEIKAIENSSI